MLFLSTFHPLCFFSLYYTFAGVKIANAVCRKRERAAKKEEENAAPD